MVKFAVFIMLVSGLVLADAANWKSFKSDGKYFVTEFPCSANNLLIKAEQNRSERLYKCDFNGSTYSLSQSVYTEAGKKLLKSRPSTLVEDTSRNLALQYRDQKITVELNKIYLKFPYRVLNFVANGGGKKYYTTIFDGPETTIVFNGTGSTAEDANLKKASDSIKPN